MVRAIDWRMRPPFADWKESYLYTRGAVTKRKDKPKAITEWNMDYLIRDMDEAGMVAAVTPHRLGQNPSYLVKLQELYPKKFYGFIHVDPFDMKNELKNIDNYVVDGPLHGVIMEVGQHFIKESMHIDDERLFPVYEKCQEKDIVLTLSFGGMLCSKLEYYNPVHLDNLATMFPNLKIVCGHGGWPYTKEIIHVAYQRTNVYISPDVYMMPIHPGYMDYVVAANNMLKEKILFGTAYPAFYPKESINMYLSLPLTESAIEHVLYLNAARLLKIEKA